MVQLKAEGASPNDDDKNLKSSRAARKKYSLIRSSLIVWLRSFGVVLSVKMAISLLPMLIKAVLSRGSRRKGINPIDKRFLLESLVNNGRFAASIATTFGGYRLIKGIAIDETSTPKDNAKVALAGFLSALLGISTLMPVEERKWLGQYWLLRILLSWYRIKQINEQQKQMPSSNDDNNSVSAVVSGPLLFAFTAAQIIYGYLVYPESLPPSYLSFLKRLSPTPDPVFNMIEGLLKPAHASPSFTTTNDTIKSNARVLEEMTPGFKNFIAESYPKLRGQLIERDAYVPGDKLACSLLHPKEPRCERQFLTVVWEMATKAPAFYFPLYLISTLLMRHKSLFKRPDQTFAILFENVARSSAFLLLYSSFFQGTLCTLRNWVIGSKDHRYYVWLAGLIPSFSILVERPSRISELNLYLLPKALDVLWHIWSLRKWVPSDPVMGKELMFSIAMSLNFYFYEKAASASSNIDPTKFVEFVKSTISFKITQFLLGTQ